MICKKCGARLEKDQTVCEICGYDSQSVYELIEDMETKKKSLRKKSILTKFAFIIIFALIVCVFSLCCSYKRTLNQFMKAFEARDGEAIYELYSQKTLKALYIMDSDIINAYRMTQKEIEDAYIYSLEEYANGFFLPFDEALGEEYKLNYKIIDVYEYDDQDISDLNQGVRDHIGSEAFNQAITFYNVIEITVEFTGRSGDSTYSDNMCIILSKDVFFWKIFSIE